MKLLPLAALGLALLTTAPTQALTLQQAQAELAGGFCVGNTCTFKPVQSGALTNPGLPTSTGPSPSICNGRVGYWSEPAPGLCNINLSSDFNHGRGTVDTRRCSVTAKTLAFNAGVRDPAQQWSITVNVSSRPGAC